MRFNRARENVSLLFWPFDRNGISCRDCRDGQSSNLAFRPKWGKREFAILGVLPEMVRSLFCSFAVLAIRAATAATAASNCQSSRSIGQPSRSMRVRQWSS